MDEELSWSKTFKCKHIFHSECLIPWLMKHEDCPCCRTTLITTQDFLDRTYDCVDNKSKDDYNGKSKRGSASPCRSKRDSNDDNNGDIENGIS